MTDDQFLEVAASILDGTPVSWDTLPEPASEADRGFLKQLRLLDELTRANHAAQSLLGTRWGPLLIVERIGSGTFGDVYKARDNALDRDVALKLLRSFTAGRHLAEGRLLARVRHPNVVTVHGAAEHDGVSGVWMEFIQGRTLAQLVAERGPFATSEVTAIGIDVCRALAAVHASGLLHGDIKAQNVMREDGGRIVLMDFGTGQVAGNGSQAASLAGTPLYIAPEVLNGEPADAASDMYGVGVLLYFLLTGAFPIEGRTLDEVRAAHRAGARTSIRERRPDVPRRLAAVVDRATAPAKRQRYQTATDLEAAIAAATRRPLWRRPGVVAASLILAAAGVALAWQLRSGVGRATHAGAPASEQIALLDWPFAKVSRDGRWLAYQDAGTRRMWLRDLQTGDLRVLVPEWTDRRFAWAPDGRSLAFSTRHDEATRLETIDVRTGTRTVVFEGNSFRAHPFPYDWSPDGTRLLCTTELPTGEQQIVFLDLRDRSMIPIVTTSRRVNWPQISRDGRFVAFTAFAENNSEIWIARLDRPADQPQRVEGAARDASPFWLPDGRRLAFLSQREGSSGIWTVDIDPGTGAPGREPVLLKALPPQSDLSSVSDVGDLFVSRRKRSAQVFLLPVDPVRGEPAASPHSMFPQETFDPAWSTDGRKLYFRTASPDQLGTVIERDLETGVERTFRFPPGYTVRLVAQSPVGSTLTFHGSDRSGRMGFYEYQSDTRTVTPLWMTDDRVNPPLSWSPDGTQLLFPLLIDDERSGVRVFDRLSRHVRTIAFSWSPPFPQWSPDGTLVAYTDRECLMVVRATGGSGRQLTCAPPAALPPGDYLAVGGLTWSPDARKIAWTVHNQELSRIEIWFVDTASGTHVAWPAESGYRSWPHDPRWSPAGNQIAFTMDYKREYEILRLTGVSPTNR